MIGSKHFSYDLIFQKGLTQSNSENIKVGLPPSRNVCFICFSGMPLKAMKMFFISCQKHLHFSRYLNFCHDFFGHVGKRCDK